ncbi:MAG: HDOD domain-containing protein [Candidatus Goldbacteria bacterium]|nr:HDOD domain-containing protein [Candidatus Goldiibacteriota bacterium]
MDEKNEELNEHDDRIKEQEERVNKILGRMKALPTLSLVVARVIQVVSNPLTSAKDLSDIITVDQALTAKVLRLANSAFYGFPFRIKNITQAVSILGFDTIRNLALTVSVYKVFTGDSNSGFSHIEFWKHCVGTAICASLIAKKIKYRSPESAFTAGLLHDIGKNFFEQYMHKEYREALKMVKDNRIPIEEAEKIVIGIDHALVGKWMAEKWNLPIELKAGIASHHHPELEQEEVIMANIIFAANILCKKKSIGFSGDDIIIPISAQASELLGINSEVELKIMEHLERELKEAEAFINMPQ